MPPWDTRPELAAAITTIRQTPDLNIPVTAMEGRGAELIADSVVDDSRDYAPVLAGIAASPRARALFDLAMDKAVAADSEGLKMGLLDPGPHYVKEVVIGSGIHAAIYASTVSEPPLVIEQRERIGGVFALARREVFLLNSRNRSESLSERRRPGTRGPLNSEVGGLLQASDIGGQEYQTQADQAFVTRVNLIMNARILTGVKILSVSFDPDRIGRFRISVKAPNFTADISTDCLIIASGVGEPTIGFNVRGNCPGLMTFDQFIAEVGDPSNLFPLKSYRNVAVVGANDSGNVAVEYLLGQAGDQALSVASLDTVKAISWIGQSQLSKESFEQVNRSRYKGIGRSMPRASDPNYYYRVYPRPGRAVLATPEDGGTRLRWRNEGEPERSEVFDHVIICTGFEDQMDVLLEELNPSGEENVVSGAKVVGRKLRGEAVYKVGPAAKLSIGDIERRDVPIFEQLPDNSVAVFRYSELTASLAKLIEQPTLKASPLLMVKRRRSSLLEVRSDFSVKIGAPITLPSEVVSEDVLRCAQIETFTRRYSSFTLRLNVRCNDRFRCVVTVNGSPPSRRTCEETYRFVEDPSVQTVLRRYFNQYSRVNVRMLFNGTPRGLLIEGSG